MGLYLNASNYRTNGLYRTRNPNIPHPNPSPLGLVRYPIYNVVRYCSP